MIVAPQPRLRMPAGYDTGDTHCPTYDPFYRCPVSIQQAVAAHSRPRSVAQRSREEWRDSSTSHHHHSTGSGGLYRTAIQWVVTADSNTERVHAWRTRHGQAAQRTQL